MRAGLRPRSEGFVSMDRIGKPVVANRLKAGAKGPSSRRDQPGRAPWRGVFGLSVLLIGGFGVFLAVPRATAPSAVPSQVVPSQGPAVMPAPAKAVAAVAVLPVAAPVQSGAPVAPGDGGASAEGPAAGEAPATGWIAASEEQPAFGLGPLPQSPGTASLIGLMATTGVVEGVRHASGGGRDDAFTMGDAGERGPLLRLSLYRPGSEPQPGGSFFVDVARRAGEAGMWVERFAGLPPLETRLGPVEIAQARFGARSGARNCMIFRQNRAQPELRLSGWICLDGQAAPAPEAVACVIDAVRWQRDQEEPQITQLFARAAASATNSACAQPSGDLTSAIRPVDGARSGDTARR